MKEVAQYRGKFAPLSQSMKFTLTVKSYYGHILYKFGRNIARRSAMYREMYN